MEKYQVQKNQLMKKILKINKIFFIFLYLFLTIYYLQRKKKNFYS